MLVLARLDDPRGPDELVERHLDGGLGRHLPRLLLGHRDDELPLPGGRPYRFLAAGDDLSGGDRLAKRHLYRQLRERNELPARHGAGLSPPLGLLPALHRGLGAGPELAGGFAVVVAELDEQLLQGADIITRRVPRQVPPDRLGRTGTLPTRYSSSATSFMPADAFVTTPDSPL